MTLYDAWTGGQNPTPDVNTPFRTGAGHLHIGWTEGQDIALDQHKQICEHLIRNLDLYTTPFLMLEEDVLRRKLYGKAGSYRPKSYGVEYRTPSNVWLTSEKNMRLMWASVRKAIIACVHNKGMLQVGTGDRLDLKWMYRRGKDNQFFNDYNIVEKVLKEVGGELDYEALKPVAVAKKGVKGAIKLAYADLRKRAVMFNWVENGYV